ncbi:4-hydroxybenzoate transporter PcaK [Lactococcus lactis]|nr:4-hydroxybenzoate transporter PcaK [Lactococcus lactis]
MSLSSGLIVLSSAHYSHQIAQDFHATISQTALGVTTYALCEMIGAPLFGPLGDRFSKRKLLITGMSLFLGATLLCAIATNLATFHIYRAAAGLGALISPKCLGIHWEYYLMGN